MDLQNKSAVRGAGQAVNDRKVTKKLPMYSKQWSPGDTVRVFYNVFQYEDTGTWDFVAGDCWGYKVNDIKQLGLRTSFIPALCEFDINGQPVGKPDICYRFSKLAPAFVKGQHLAETLNLLKKPGLSETMKLEAMKTIDEKYDTKNNMKAIRPIIGYASSLIVIEAIVVPIVNGTPSYESLVVCMLPLSDAMYQKLHMILNSERFRPNEGETWLEIEVAYPMATEKSESGRKAVPAGISAEYRLSVTAPEKWEEIKSAMTQFSDTSDMIVKRATSAVSEGRICQALTNYTAINSEHLDECAEDADILATLESSIGVLSELKLEGVIRDPRLTELLSKVIAEAATEVEELPAPSEPANITIDKLIEESAELTTEAEDFLNDIDLGAIGGN